MRYSLKQKFALFFWIISAVTIGIFLMSIIFTNYNFKKTIASKTNTATVIEPLTQKETTSQYFYFKKDPNNLPKVGASAFLIGDLDTGEIILTKNKDEQFPLASVSKLMTASVAKDLMNDEDIAKVSKKALSTYGKNGNLKLGEKIKITDLVYPLLLESSNDSAEVIAEYFSRNVFVQRMNQTAQKLDLSKTTFEDPSGLSPNNKSTVYDMFKLAGYLNEQKQDLLKITINRSYSNQKHTWFSNNQFLREKSYLGGKSGYTDEAKQTVISLFSIPLGETGTRNIGITLLQSKDRFKDVENILKYLNTNIYYGGESDANTLWVKERTDIPEVYDQDFVTLLFGGDIMLDRGVKSSVNKNFNGDYSKLFEKLDLFNLLKTADITFANLEGPASDIGKDMRNLYSFRMSPSTLPALKGAGLSIVSVANNHVGDWTRDAYSDTLVNLKENEILYTGGGANTEEAENPTIIEKYGIKIGFLGFSDVGPNWMGVNTNKAGLLLANNPRLSEIINNASKKVDYLIVTFHFGDEYQTKHNMRQEHLAHSAIDAGAKIIIGTHPHVVQDTEVYKNGFIAYSLGNFIFDQGFSVNTMQGMLLELKLNKDGNITIKKNTVKLNKFFQPNTIIKGKEEKIKF
ncbi:MAG: CapA family protein [Candidatus Paceibacterota bacterium]|jgi:poly-gamma-glutamate synthesis protein (capsule biosynthesis protein)